MVPIIVPAMPEQHINWSAQRNNEGVCGRVRCADRSTSSTDSGTGVRGAAAYEFPQEVPCADRSITRALAVGSAVRPPGGGCDDV
jgi:hypothetical protein